MGRFRGCVAIVCLATAAAGCRSATAIDVSVESEVSCDAGATAALVGSESLGALQAASPKATSHGCTAGDGGLAAMGNVVIVPIASKSESVAFAVMTRPDGQSPGGCLAASEASHCIVAKRQLNFIPHTTLALAVDLRLSCLGVQCSTDQTCVKGMCVGAQVPTSCEPSCNEGALLPADGGTTPDATTPPDAGSDSGLGISGLNGTTYYVSVNGDDTNAGTMASPWKTIQNAGAFVGPGDTVVVLAGKYDGAVFFDAPPCQGDVKCAIAGTAANPILFEADPSAPAGSVVIGGRNTVKADALDLEGCSYVDIAGFTFNNGGTSDLDAGSISSYGIFLIRSEGNQILDNTFNGISTGMITDEASNIVIRGNTMAASPGTGLDIGVGSGVQILDNHLFGSGNAGLQMVAGPDGPPNTITNALVSGNYIHDNHIGINGDGVQSSVFQRNVIYANVADGLRLFQGDSLYGSASNVIVSNTFDQSMDPGAFAIDILPCSWGLGDAGITPGCATPPYDTSTGNVAFDNVLLGGAGPTQVVSSADLALSTNITEPSGSLFVDADAGNYTLAPGGPGVGTGIATFGDAGAPAASPGRYDIGAF